MKKKKTIDDLKVGSLIREIIGSSVDEFIVYLGNDGKKSKLYFVDYGIYGSLSNSSMNFSLNDGKRWTIIC